MKKLILFVIFLIIGGFTFSQTLVNPGSGNLYNAIHNAKAGDVLQLIPGGTYTFSTGLTLDTLSIPLTIEAEPGFGTQKAIVQITNPGTSTNPPVFFFLTNGASLTLSGIEFDGSINGTPTVDNLFNFDVGSIPANIEIGTIKIENCEIHNFAGDIINAINSSFQGYITMDSLYITNSVIHDCGTIVQAKYMTLNYMNLSNSTFYNVNTYGVRFEGANNGNITPTAYITNTTWYNIGGTSRGFTTWDYPQNPVYVTNTIWDSVGNQQNKGFYVKTDPTSYPGTLDTAAYTYNTCFWEDGVRDWRQNVFIDTVTMDPNFVNPANGDFTLPKGSPLLTFGKNGGAIGDPRWATNAPTAVLKNPSQIPAKFELDQNYPNPFNPTTTITFSLNKSGMTSLNVYNVLGQKVATLVNSNMSAGQHTVSFNALNLSSGVYIYQLSAGSKILSKKMILLK